MIAAAAATADVLSSFYNNKNLLSLLFMFKLQR